ncbi:MAG TPA: hypothetical protein VFH26_08490, partial [Gemmatimonadales bacterium]|nr:hypothetical protein [Gemmatimonadales bacterium]
MIKHLALEEFWRLQEVRRVAAAESRRTGLSAGAEPVRHVLDAAHLHLASHLAHEGFHYSRTGKYLYRRSDGISHRIAFTTSDANIPDKFIALYIHFHVRCPKFAGWRAEHGGVHTDLISHRWLADFEPGVIAVEHELGPRSTRDE